MLGRIVYWLYPSRRKITRRNISACFPDWSARQVNQVSRAHFQHMLIGAMTLSIAWWATARRLEKLVTFENIEYLERRIARGDNIILLTPHFANLEFLGIFLFTRYRMSAIYKPNRNPRLDNFIQQRRSRYQGKLYKHTEFSKELLRSTRRGIPLYYLPDQDAGNWGVFAPFFGIPTATFSSLGRIAKLTKATVIPCAAIMAETGRTIKIRFDAPMQGFPTGTSIEDATLMNKAVEKLVEAAPEQYFWSHKRFKTRPLGEQPFYQ